MTGDTKTERVVEVKDIDPRHRHMVIQQLFQHLTPGASLQLVVDHDPKPLRVQLETRYGTQRQRNYLEQRPDTWHVRQQRRLIAGAEVIYRIVKVLVGPFPASKEESDPQRSLSPSRANRIELLAIASQGSGECPAWIIMELEAREKAEREPAYGEEKERS